MKHSQRVFLLTGSNIEPRLGYLEQAEIEISRLIGNIVKCSQVYESEPWGFDEKSAFLNKVLIVETDLSADEVLKEILSIEETNGRVRKRNGYSSRTLDIDILFYGKSIIENDDLVVPHPRLHQRRFTLSPLVEIAPDFQHPVFNKSCKELLNQVNDNSKVWIYQPQKA